MLIDTRFQEKFKWMPSEGQLRSQFWYFKKSAVSAAKSGFQSKMCFPMKSPGSVF